MRYLLILIVFIATACSEIQPQVSLLTAPSNLPVVFNDFTPSKSPTNSSDEISISALDIGLYSELKWTLVNSMQRCDQVDFNEVSALPVYESFRFLPMEEGIFRVCVIGKNNVTQQWQSPNEATASRSLEIDRTPPSGDFEFLHSLPAISSSHVDIKLNPLDGAEQYSIFNNGYCSGTPSWENIPMDFKLTRTLTNLNEMNPVSVKYRDRAGNESVCSAKEIRHDNIPPGIVVAPPAPSTGTILSEFRWVVSYSGAEEINLQSSDIELQGTATAGCAVNIETSSDPKDRIVKVFNCQQEGSVSFILKADTAKDLAGNKALAVNTGVQSITISNTRPSVTLTPNIARNSYTNSSVIVVNAEFSSPVQGFTDSSIIVTGGIGTVAYTGPGNTYVITLTLQTEGQISLAIPENAAQDAATLANSIAGETLTWTYDITPPMLVGLTDDPNWTKRKTWPLTCSEGGCTFAYSISTTPSSAGSNFLQLSEVSSSGTETGTYYLNVVAKDRAGNISVTSSVMAKLDNTRPTVSTLTSPDFYSASIKAYNLTTETPRFNFTSNDNSGSVTTQAQLARNSNSSVIKTWQTFTSGGKFTGLSLIHGEQYTISIKAIDAAGNESTPIRTLTWIVDTQMPDNFTFTLGSTHSSPSETPLINIPSSPTDATSGIEDFYFDLLDASDNVVTTFPIFVKKSGLNLTVGQTYRLRAVITDHAGNVRTTAPSASWLVQFCPEGYERVPHTPDDFCVAKYEMKNVSNVATSVPDGTPWINIARGAGPNDVNTAWNACHKLNNGSGTHYNLIANEQWQAIANNIESNAVNWSGGVVGSGFISRGYTDAPGGYNGNGVHALNDLDGCGDGKQGCAFEYKRRHTLSNGSVIYDLSGNVWEWVRTNNSLDLRSYDPGLNERAFHEDITNFSDRLYSPLNPSYGETQGMGVILSVQRLQTDGGGGPGVIRGGRMTDGSMAGIYSANINVTISSQLIGNHVGFRCVYEP